MIDGHVHLFPDEATGRAWQQVVGFDATRPGTVEDLESRMRAARIERAIVLLFPRSAHRRSELRAARPPLADQAIRARLVDEIRALNRWGCDLAARDARFVAFIGADASVMGARELVDEIRRGAAAGARGVKILPAAMRLYPGDPRLDPVFATCVELGLPVLSQSGSGGSAEPGPRGPFGRPAAFGPVLAAHPSLRLVLAHLGRGLEDELIELVGRHPGVASDTSLRLGSPHDPWEPGVVRSLIRRLGADRVIFGTNYPIADPVLYRERLNELRLGREEAARITSGNAQALIGD
jgi:predicted TIM-barrel fold metal-dependent hydrolase